MFLKKAFSFLKKDFLIEVSYKLAFLLNIFGILASILTFYFIDKLFGYKMVPHLEPYGGNYFAYVLVGIAFFTYVGTGLGSLSGRIREEQMMGTLEAVLVTPTSISTLIVAMSLWNFIIASVDVVIYLLLGAFLLKVDLTNTNLLSAFLVLLLTVISFNALGIMAASFIMVFKRGNPVPWIMNTAAGLLGGVYFPITVLPQWLRFFSYFLPITYSIRAMQLAVYKGYSLSQLTWEITVLSIFSLFLVPLSILSFKYAIRKAKKDGSLVHY